MDILQKLEAAEELLAQAQEKLAGLDRIDIHQTRLAQVIEGTKEEMRSLREKKAELLRQLSTLAFMVSQRDWVQFKQFLKGTNGRSVNFYMECHKETVVVDGTVYPFLEFVSQGLVPSGSGDYVGFYWLCKQMLKLVASYLNVVPKEHVADLEELEKLLVTLSEDATKLLAKA